MVRGWLALLAACRGAPLPDHGEPSTLVVAEGVTCAVRRDHPIVACVGAGFGARPVAIGGVDATRGVAVGEGFGCAVDGDGVVVCWGRGDRGQLGRDVVGEHPPTPIGVDAVQVVAGRAHACARDADGGVRCWGDARDGQLGDGRRDPRPAPAPVPGLPPVTWLAAAGSRTCGLAEGVAWCWGGGADGPTPSALRDAVDLVVSPAFVCVRTAVGGVRCDVGGDVAGSFEALASSDDAVCGLDRSGEVACGAPGAVPTRVAGVPRASRLAAGGGVTCAEEPNGALWCWGDARTGQMGHLPPPAFSEPVGVKGVERAFGLRASGATTCAERREGWWCWGGSAGATPERTPGAPPPIRAASCTSDGALRCGERDLPLGDVSYVDGDAERGCAVAGAAVWCWGVPAADGTVSPEPVRVPRVRGATALAVGDAHACGLLPDTTVRCWGSAADGRLGTGTSEVQGLPVRVPW